MADTLQRARVVVLVKALPNPSRKYGETVCCAGVTVDRSWKRLYPIRFRQLGENKFDRWNWVSYEYRPPTTDLRRESCHVYEDRISVDGTLKKEERARLLEPMVLGSTPEASALGNSLTLIRPRNTKFVCRRKPAAVIEAERDGYRRVGRQSSFLDKDVEAIEPSPMAFSFTFDDEAGKHNFRCGDWETHTTFWKWSRVYGEAEATKRLSETYNDRYPAQGMVFALGTVKARPKQWILLGVIRLDETDQTELQV